MSKWTLKEAISPSTIERELGKYKAKAKGALTGPAEDYVDILEFTAQFLAGHTSVNDKELKKFLAFVDKMLAKGGSSPDLKTKGNKVDDIEDAIEGNKDPEEIELDASDVQPVDDKGKAMPPPPPKDADEEDPKSWFGKDGTANFSSPSTATKPKSTKPKAGKTKEKSPKTNRDFSKMQKPDAPSLGKLAGKDNPDSPDTGDVWDKALKTAKSLQSKMPGSVPNKPDRNPADFDIDVEDSGKDPGDFDIDVEDPPVPQSIPKSMRSAAGGGQPKWSVGQKVDVGQEKGLTVRRKVGLNAYTLEKGDDRFLYDVGTGKLKPIRK